MKFISCLLVFMPFWGIAQNPDTKQPEDRPAQPGDRSDPQKARFVTEDIARFWEAFDSAAVDTADAAALLKSLYLDKGTLGLKKFNEVGIKGVDALAAAIKKYRPYYESVRPRTLQIATLEDTIRKSLVKMKRLYPEARLPDIYFLVGDLNAGGKSEKEGLLIGAEVNCADDNTDFQNLPPAVPAIFKALGFAHIPSLVAHELVHYQQSYRFTDKNVLAYAIMEGSADFIGEKISGRSVNIVPRIYGDAHEKELWLEFEKDAHTDDLNKWLYNGGGSLERPGDLGYYIGYKITEAYYRRSRDKARAIKEILNITDFDAFLKESGYGRQFE
ncbi:MAG: DUF2268 domain-containing putative Zn-dependent protease [Puia sp.]|nr:DUF2268 domain-containing putative Zn-dependent protease [Puia sp.]